VRAGQLVVATPLLGDPNFAKTVVLLLQVDEDDGALGLVLNRPTGTGVDEVLPDWSSCRGPAGGLRRRPGPAAGGHLPRPRPARRPALRRLRRAGGCPGASLGTVDLDSTPGVLRSTVDRVRVYAGYAGWGAGQLEAEVEEGAWFVLDALPADAFSGAPDQLWKAVLLRQGPPVAFAASYPDDPTLN
jgi:putative transcriptional regulator